MVEECDGCRGRRAVVVVLLEGEGGRPGVGRVKRLSSGGNAEEAVGRCWLGDHPAAVDGWSSLYCMEEVVILEREKVYA